MTGVDPDGVQRAHVVRVAALDPALAPQPVLRPDAGSWFVGERADGSCGVGLATTTEVGEGDPAASFRALREHRLRGRVAGPDVRGVLGDLLDRWGSEARAAAPAARDVLPADDVLAVTWPSRDVEAAAALLDRGFRPTNVLAVRSLPPGDRERGPSAAPTPRAPVNAVRDVGHHGADVRVRHAGPQDVAVVAALQLAELRYDALVGSARVRPTAARTVTAAVEHAVARPGTTVLLAEVDGRAVGVVGVDHPGIASEASTALAHDLVAYVVVLHVDSGARGRGIGRVLVDAAVETVRPALDRDDGTTAALALHHGVLNPLSAPFWARSGFRPALTSWERPTAERWAPVSAARPRLGP